MVDFSIVCHEPTHATACEGMGKIHVLDGLDATLCGKETQGMAVGTIAAGTYEGHSEACKRCQQLVDNDQ